MRPLPVRSSRNFGVRARESGHSRVPAPAGRDDGPEAVQVGGGHGAHPAIRPPDSPALPWPDELPVNPPRTFPELLAARLRERPGPTPRHGVRRRHRRAHRAVGDDVRQLGEQDREPAHRRARSRRRATRCCSTCRRTGWCRCSSARPGAAALAVTTDRRRSRTTSWSADPTRSTGTTAPTRSWPARCCPFAVRFAEPLPPGVLDYGVLWPGQSDVFVPLEPPTPDTAAWLTRRRAHAGRAARGGRRGRLRTRACGCSPTCTRPPTTGCRRSSVRWSAGARWCCCATRRNSTWPARLRGRAGHVQLERDVPRSATRAS